MKSPDMNQYITVLFSFLAEFLATQMNARHGLPTRCQAHSNRLPVTRIMKHPRLIMPQK